MDNTNSIGDVHQRLQTLEREVSHLRADRDRLKETVLGLMEAVQPFPILSPDEYAILVEAGPSTAIRDLLAEAERELLGTIA